MGANNLKKRTPQERLIIAKTLLETVLDDMPYAEKVQLSGEDATKDATSDLISRQDAIEAVETKIKKWNAVDGEGYHVGLGLRYTDVIDTLTELPSAEPERKRGHWINAYPDIEPNPMFMYVICSVCGYVQSISNKLNFCPDCGADMREGETG